jgi:hypothetical protein
LWRSALPGYALVFGAPPCRAARWFDSQPSLQLSDSGVSTPWRCELGGVLDYEELARSGWTAEDGRWGDWGSDMGSVGEIYRRVVPFVRAVPLVLALPFAAELLQHTAEIRLGMYAHGGMLTHREQGIRLAFGAVKILALLIVVIFALRWWRFGDARRAARPTWAMAKGLVIVLLVDTAGETATVAVFTLIAALLGGAAAGHGARLAITLAPFLLWAFFANLLYPWFVALLTEDREMTLARSLRGTRGRLPSAFAILLAGILPAMVVHYVLGYGAMHVAGPLVWAMMLVDAGLVALMAVLIASTFFTLYRLAAARAPA